MLDFKRIRLYFMRKILLVQLTHRLSTVDSGSLLISEVQATDAGKYECSAQSMAGSRTAPAVIKYFGLSKRFK